jgi:glycosyltransferase involved in cell wall biosynthesis
MKICLINPSDFYRKEIFDLGSLLAKRDHDVTILYPTNDKKLNSDVKIKSFPAKFVPKIHYTIPNLLLEYNLISKLIVEEQYDIVHACNSNYLTSLPPAVIKRKTNIPFVLTTDGFPGISWFFGNSFVDKVGYLYNKTLGRFIIDSCDEFVVLSKNLANDATDLGIPSKKVTVIPNGVDFEQFHPNIESQDIKKELNLKNDEKVILFIGRLSLVKRVNILIDVSKQLLKEGFKIKTVIVGDGEYKDYYKRMVGNNENIIFVGFIPYLEIQKYIAVADVLVLPSLSEGLPNILLEAAACAKPVVATNTGGISDIVIHGKTGFLVDQENFNSFLEYIRLILNDEDLAKKLGNNAYEHVKKEFNWSMIVEHYEQIYESFVQV